MRRGTGRQEGVAETPTSRSIGRRPNGVLGDAWRRDADRQLPPTSHLRAPPSVLSSSATRSTREPRRRASLLREDGAARPVRFQELRQRGWRTRAMQNNHRTTSVREDHPQCRAFARRFCGERWQYVFLILWRFTFTSLEPRLLVYVYFLGGSVWDGCHVVRSWLTFMWPHSCEVRYGCPWWWKRREVVVMGMWRLVNGSRWFVQFYSVCRGWCNGYFFDEILIWWSYQVVWYIFIS